MNEEMKSMIEDYIKANVMPIMISVDKNIFKNYTEIPANCSNETLKGTFDLEGYKSPLWYEEVKKKENDNVNLLIITDFDKIDKEKQKKFTELLKYRKIGTLNLPKNCAIIVLANSINKESIDKEIYSLVAHIN